MSNQIRVLHLSLKAKPFAVMVTGEKGLEFRKTGQWILSRLQGKRYDFIKFTNGYGSDKPYFICEFRGWWLKSKAGIFEYSNGLIVKVAAGDVVIDLGMIVETGNLKENTP